MTYYVCVARETIRTNNVNGRNDPVWLVYTDIEGKGEYTTARRVRFKGPSSAIFNNIRPLPNGATAWIQTDAEIEID